TFAFLPVSSWVKLRGGIDVRLIDVKSKFESNMEVFLHIVKQISNYQFFSFVIGIMNSGKVCHESKAEAFLFVQKLKYFQVELFIGMNRKESKVFFKSDDGIPEFFSEFFKNKFI